MSPIYLKMPLMLPVTLLPLQPVRWFWEVVHAFSETKKKRLLFFVTGSDRVPIKVRKGQEPRMYCPFLGSALSPRV